MEWTLELAGAGLGKPVVFTYKQLAGMEMSGLGDVLQQMTHFSDKRASWRGPKLEALLGTAEIKPGPMVFTLEAKDGYRMKCSRADLDSAIVALQDGEGRWLAEIGVRCMVRLVPPRLTGDYWIRNIHRITVEPAAASGAPQ